MGDPLSIITGVIAITGATIQSIQLLIKLTANARSASEDIRSVVEDAQAFRSILVSLEALMKHQTIQEAIREDRSILEMVENLIQPLGTCRAILEALTSKTQNLLKPEHGGFGSHATSFRWSMSTKNQVAKLQMRLQAAKSTFGRALDAINTLCVLRLLAVRSLTAAQPLEPFAGLHRADIVRIVSEPSLRPHQHQKTVGAEDHASKSISRHRGRSSSPADGDTEPYHGAADIFYDCTSTPRSRSPQFGGGVQAFYYEKQSSYYPENYAVEGLFDEAVFMVAAMRCREDEQCYRYFLTYAQTPRKWRRIVLEATYIGAIGQALALQASITDINDNSWKPLPVPLHKLLRRLLAKVQLFDAISRITLSIVDDGSKYLTAQASHVEVSEDRLENELCDERSAILDLKDLSCLLIPESQVSVRSRLASTRYEVWVGTQIYVERRARFASATGGAANGFGEFMRDLKQHHALSAFRSLVQFAGVVVDDSRRHIRGYLHEVPVTSLMLLLAETNARSETMPWSTRKSIMVRVVEVMSRIHREGLVAGVIVPCTFNFRIDGTIVISQLGTYPKRILNRQGEMPPELRHTKSGSKVAVNDQLNYQTDIFQLGLVLWQIAEQKHKCHGIFCARSACTNVPRHLCTADHVNPVELPVCKGNESAFLNDLINKCRSRHPEARPSALEIAKALQQQGWQDEGTPEIAEYLDKHITGNPYAVSVWCDECSAQTTETYHHCYECIAGDLDLCPRRFENGIRCKVAEHQLVKLEMKNGVMVRS